MRTDPVTDLDAAIANPRPGSFLAWMVDQAANTTPDLGDDDPFEFAPDPELHEMTYHVNRHREFPFGCRWCGKPKRGHLRNEWTPIVDGYHEWTEPTQGQIKARMHARRAARLDRKAAAA